MSETHEEEHVKPLPYNCVKCKDEGLYLLPGIGYQYCTCAAGVRAEEEDRGERLKFTARRTKGEVECVECF